MEQILDQFQYLGTVSHDHAVEQINSFLMSDPSIICSEELQPYILDGIQAPSLKVRSFTLSVLQDYFPLSGPNDLLLSLVPLLFSGIDSELQEIAIKSSELIFQIAIKLKEDELGIIFNTENFSTLKKIEASNVMKQLRVLNLAIRLASISEWCFDFVQSCGFLEEATYLEQADLDPVHCLNSLSLIEKLAESPRGLDYLSESGTLDKIQNLLKKERTLYPFFLSEMIRVLSLLSTKKDQQDWWDRGHFLETFEHFLECGDIEFQEAAISAMARIGETETGLHQIVCHPKLLKNFVQFVRSSTSILCNSCLHSLAIIFRTCPEDESLLQQIYSELPKENESSSPISCLLPYASNQTEEEAHIAFFDLIRSLSFHTWSAEKLLLSPGVFEWLISRPNSLTKQDAEWKYEIVSVLLETIPKEVGENLLGMDKFRELKRYFNQGVFFVPRNVLGKNVEPRMETTPIS